MLGERMGPIGNHLNIQEGLAKDTGRYRTIVVPSYALKGTDARIAFEFTLKCKYSEAQLGLKRNTGTDTAIYGHIKYRQKLKRCVVLDPKSAFNMVLPNTLMEVVERILENQCKYDQGDGTGNDSHNKTR